MLSSTTSLRYYGVVLMMWNTPLQGKVLSLGMLKTAGEWINSFAVILVSTVLFGINSLVRWYYISKDERKRANALSSLGGK